MKPIYRFVCVLVVTISHEPENMCKIQSSPENLGQSIIDMPALSRSAIDNLVQDSINISIIWVWVSAILGECELDIEITGIGTYKELG